MSIPMPGHPVSSNEVAGVLDDIRRLKELVDDHDVIFLLTDTRESRWLPTLLCADANKVHLHTFRRQTLQLSIIFLRRQFSYTF